MLDRLRDVLCVAAHPDDEVLGCGATLATLAARGHNVHVLVLGEGVGARYVGNGRSDEETSALSREFVAAAAVLGVTPHQHDLPDQRFDSWDILDVVKLVERMKLTVEPDHVFTHHPRDLNVDHRITANAVFTSFRPQPGEKPVTLLGFETLSSTEWNVPANGDVFAPNWYEDASLGLEKKLAAMGCYRHELREWPHPRSLEGVRVAARQRGMCVGLESAEAFMLLRHVSAS